MSKNRQVNKLMDQSTWDAMKAVGYTEEELLAEQPFGPMVASYSRRQCIEDGQLVDLMQNETQLLVKQAGFKIPVAMTTTAFVAAVAPIDEDLPPGQDLKGRLWDVLMCMLAAIRKNRDTDRVHFSVSVWNGAKHETVNLWSLIGPGDEGEPVLTIMLEGED